ncbi:response regulator transcription factor [Larkinella rosea]|uniref:DNA-binding response regulator n=1 Tax=Larkinella rosea TaxID=2025312 RepID=A0A3P1B9A3_9BACT|nr:response regulator transcription factor [Larkinella rosea]RRA97608.1 DNA-binding response regulator [Larkinella rosea]
MKTSIVIADNHHVQAQALVDQIQKFENYVVCFVAKSGRDLIRYLSRGTKTDIVLLDVSRTETDAFETAAYLKDHFPGVKVVALSGAEQDENLLRMFLNGVRGYLPKDCRPAELRRALDELRGKGYYYSEFSTDRFFRSLHSTANQPPKPYYNFSLQEHVFLKMACSDLTYAEIADKMCVSTRTVDGYREALFQKMNVKSRVGMALEAVRWGLVQL